MRLVSEIHAYDSETRWQLPVVPGKVACIPTDFAHIHVSNGAGGWRTVTLVWDLFEPSNVFANARLRQ